MSINSLQDMIANEKVKNASLSKWVVLSGLGLHNILQDLRHVALLDDRPDEEMDENLIRDSIPFRPKSSAGYSTIVAYLKSCEKKAQEFEKKYKPVKVRRIVVVPRKNTEEHYKVLFDEVLDICKANEIDITKIYILTETIPVLAIKYSHFILDKAAQESVIKYKSQGNNAEMLKDEHFKKVMYSHSRFPFILHETQLLLGTGFNSNNQRQMKDLGVKSVIHFDCLKVEKGVELPQDTQLDFFDEGDLKTLRVTLNPQKFIQFDVIFEEIRKLPSPRLICDSSDMTVASNFAIAYMMNVNNCDVNKASLFVFSKMGVAEADRLIYSQLMMYSTTDNGKFKKI